MEVEKRSSKGGFFQLFDWNVKSRKKLFSNKSELSESSNQGKENSNSVAISQLQQMKLHENGPNLSVRGSDYCCVSTSSSDEGCGTKAPGVVARLMGLDSLPTSDVTEPYSTPVFSSHLFRDSHIPRTSTGVQSEHHVVDYGNTRKKLDGFSNNTVELRLQKVQNRPIDRFQSEILPPKSARSISVTHHRLLSPIKSPGFILTKNAACIMEEAAKIIEQSPRSTTKGKLSPFGSPSVPLRIRDLKEKLEAAQKAPRNPNPSQRSKENHSMKYMKGQPSERGLRGSEDSQPLKVSVLSKQGGSRSLKDKGKSPSLTIQAKTSIQRREGNGNRSSKIQKGDNGAKSGHFDMKQLNMQKNVQKRSSAGRTSDVLKQNNLKQNCASSKERVSLKPQMTPYQQERKGISTNSSFRVSKTIKKTVESSSLVTKETNLVAADSRKELSSSKSKNFSGKKRPVNGNVNYNESVLDDVLINNNERSVKCNVSVDEFTNWDAVDGKTGTDVISFTFTSPIKKSLPGCQTSTQFIEKNTSLFLNPADDQPNSNISYLSSLGLNAVGSDALSVLLEQKLKELACRVEPSDYNLVKQGNFPSSTSTLQDSIPSLGVVNSAAFTEHEKMLHFGLLKNNPGNQHDSNRSSLDKLLLGAKQKWQESEELEDSRNSSSNNREYEKEHDCQYPIPISSQPSFSGGSCNSSDSKISFTSNGNWQCSSAETCETISCISARNPQYVEEETELSDSASSISVGGLERKDTATKFSYRKFERSSNWELEYVKGVLSNADLMLEDFVLGHAHEIITPDLFDHLENQNTEPDKTTEEDFKLERKLLFDCLNECLEFRCERISGGSYKAWIKLTTMAQRKELLAEEVYKEMRDWTSMMELMVDELVHKDMSTSYGKWVDFETEEFEEGLEIENGILSSLVDGLVIDLLS